MLIFNYVIITFVSIYYIISHLFKKNKNKTNIFFIFLMILLLIEFLLIIAVNLNPAFLQIYLISGSIALLPAAGFILLLCVSILFPAETVRRFRFLLLFLLAVILCNIVSVFFIPGIDKVIINNSMEIIKNKAAIIQSGIILIFMLIVPIPLIMKMKYTSFRRIRTTVIYYLSGLYLSYILFIAIYFSGIYFYHLPFLKNPFLPVPVLFILVFTDHLIYNLKNNDFQKFYKILSAYAFAFVVFFTPLYFFLRFYPPFFQSAHSSVWIKSSIIFIYLAITYRIIRPYTEKLRTGRLQILLHAINKTLMPVNELKKFSDMDTFWEYITNDNFQNLKYSLGIQSAYFMLINRKDNIYQFTYGYGPDLNFQFMDGKSEIAKQITSYDGVFEKSFLLADKSIKDINQDVLNFFDSNGIEISMVFKNMSDNLIGFLLLGKIEGNQSYTSDHLAALEIFRIKIQNLLITGLILDEVTAEQVAEHDKIVVSTVKQRIIPAELASIPGIRISSFYLNNSSYGGDYFDSVKIANDKTIIFIAETSYSGIDSALIGMELFSILHSRTLIFNSPEKVLNTMNQVIKTSRLTNSFARCSCMIISSDGNFSYANASHNQLLIFEPETQNFTEVETENIPLGMEMAHRYSFTTGKLKEGTIGILYSDGLFSSCNENGETFSQDKLRETVIKFSRETPSVITREIFMTYNSFVGTKEQLNDVTAIVFKKVKTENEQH
ncbi:MAG TPA: SpoIIE family protein phosphatase [Spirochaetota bacterium]|nr:SpoIIE family protein phosphatase [Spirochaetota bacterium]HPS85108.1 SpoIIE family protein phosphatase [Spirochaetota bacterium]